jgi:hypothetical protein
MYHPQNLKAVSCLMTYEAFTLKSNDMCLSPLFFHIIMAVVIKKLRKKVRKQNRRIEK